MRRAERRAEARSCTADTVPAHVLVWVAGHAKGWDAGRL